MNTPETQTPASLGAAHGSEFRDRLEAMYAAIPWWKKVLTCCVLKRKKWKLARAHNKVACSMLLTDNHELGEAVRDAGDKLWAEIYEMPNNDSATGGSNPTPAIQSHNRKSIG